MKKNMLKFNMIALCSVLSLNTYSQIIRSHDFEQIPQSGKIKNIVQVTGVKGEAANFNGYTSEWEETGLDENPETLFVEAWIAPKEYSYNVSAVVNQQSEQHQGFLLGVNYNGQLAATLYAGGERKDCVSDAAAPLLKWSHIGMAYRQGEGIQLFLNGKPVKSLAFTQPADFCSGCPLVIGKTQIEGVPAYTERVNSRAQTTWMRFNGLIDELKISAVIPSESALTAAVKQTGKAGVQALQFPQMPSAGISQGTFGAYYTRLYYDEGWESVWKVGDYPDVVVRFPNSPVKYIFWRGTGYIPAIVSENNIWMTDQSLERFVSGECYEVMGDKQCRYSHVRIIESTPARCVIHWRYALAGINHQIKNEDETGWGDWADEYWTIYPDGVGIRKQVLYSPYYREEKAGYQFQETILFNQPGTKPQDNLEMEAIQFADMQGDTAVYSWASGSPEEFKTPQYQPVQLINIKAKYRPFSIFYPERTTHPFTFGWVEGYSTFPCWNHWPVSQIRSDGRNASSPDRASHTSLTATEGHLQIVEYNKDYTQVTVRQMLGMTTKSIRSLLPLARSWNYAPALILKTKGYENKGYDVYQRAYRIKREDAKGGLLKFIVRASESSPVENLALVIENRNTPEADVSINGKKTVRGKDYETGYIQGLEGNKMIVWIYLESTKPVAISIR